MNSKLIIPKPCHENWENMRPEEKGKFCSVCTKTVYDFTEKSKPEIIDTIANSDGKICGRFLNSQVEVPQNYLQRKVIQLNNFSQNNFQRFTFILILVSGLMTLAGCKQKTTGEIVSAANSSDTTKCDKDSMRPPLMGDIILVEDSAQIPKKKTNNLDKSHKLAEPILQKKVKNK